MKYLFNIIGESCTDRTAYLLTIFLLSMLCFLSTVCIAKVAEAGGDKKIFILTSNDAKAYQDALQGIKYRFTESYIQKQIHILTKSAGSISSEKIEKDILKFSPELLMSIGTPATEILISANLPKPLVYCMLLDPPDKILKAKNSTGVLLDIPLETQLEWFLLLKPDLKKVAVAYSKNSKQWFQKAQKAAQKKNLKVLGINFDNKSDFFKNLQELNDEIDGILAIPDGTIYNRIITPRIIYFSMENKIPFMGLSQKFTSAGAFFSLDCDYYDIGVQAAEIVLNILSGANSEDLKIQHPRRIIPVINSRTARMIGITVNKDIRTKAIMLKR